jgi:hypothetical protein
MTRLSFFGPKVTSAYRCFWTVPNRFFPSFSDSSEKLSISKTCSKNTSCYMQMNATVDKYPCDTDYGNWICTTCCHEDGCNKSGAWSACAQKLELLLYVLAIVLVTASYNSWWRVTHNSMTSLGVVYFFLFFDLIFLAFPEFLSWYSFEVLPFKAFVLFYDFTSLILGSQKTWPHWKC